MTFHLWTQPTARKQHRCDFQYCRRLILPGEPYRRGVTLDEGTAFTHKFCDHCYVVADCYSRYTGNHEWDDDSIAEWLEGEQPTMWAQLQVGWRYPDGEVLPPPWQPRCVTCQTLIGESQLWCSSCNDARMERISASFVDIGQQFAAMKAAAA